VGRASVALVLGAGGVAGAAYHSGVLAALAEATGWDPRRADLVVGTSAGSGIAAWLRAGMPASDLLSRSVGRAPSAEGAALTAGLPPAGRFPPDPVPGGVPLPAAPWLLGAALLPLGRPRPVVGLAGVLPRGRRPTAVLGDRLRAVHPARWPDAPTWICAVRLRDGARVVFGRDDVPLPHLAEAVEASSAVPGLLTPVTLGGIDYVDGGAHSTTNADLVARLGFDLVVVVAPMTAVPSALRRRPDWGKLLHSRVLAAEVGEIRARGTRVLVVQPTATDLAARHGDVLSSGQVGPVAEQAFASALERLRRPDAARAAALLESARPAD
jgi:NTE family protein